jgi:hypothetical protein
MEQNFIVIFLILALVACSNQNKTHKTKLSYTDTIKSQVNKTEEEVWTIERLNKEFPYPFDTLLKNGYNLHFERTLSTEINDIVSQITLVKGQEIIDTLNTMGYAPPMKNLGYIGADFKDYFAFVQSFGSGNPHDMQLIRKKDAVHIVNGFIVDADEKNELLLYCKGYDSLMLYDISRSSDKLLVNLNKCDYITCMVSELCGYVKIRKVTQKHLEIEIAQGNDRVIRKMYKR